MSATLSAPPLQTPLIEGPKEPYITKVWASWLRALVDRAQVAAFAVKAVPLTAQAASLGLTSLSPAASGLYRVSYRLRVSTAAGVSSSLTVTITGTEGGVAVAQSSAAYTGNVTNRPQSGAFLVHADPATPIQVSTTYASNPAGVMVYELDVVLEAL